MKPPRLVLFAGMGGDSRMFGPIRLSHGELVTPEHVEPEAGESLKEYAARCAEASRVSADDVVGGASFGGMVAAQIARDRPVKGLVLLGSCLGPGGLPKGYRWLDRIARLTPDWALELALGRRSWEPLVRWRFAPVGPEAVAALQAMAADCPPLRLRRFGDMIARWPGVERPACPLLWIHGARDRIIPAAGAQPTILYPDAGHAFTLTHAARASADLSAFLAAL